MQIQKISTLQLTQDPNKTKSMSAVQPKMALPKELKIDSVSFKGGDNGDNELIRILGVVWAATCVMTMSLL